MLVAKPEQGAGPAPALLDGPSHGIEPPDSVTPRVETAGHPPPDSSDATVPPPGTQIQEAWEFPEGCPARNWGPSG